MNQKYGSVRQELVYHSTFLRHLKLFESISAELLEVETRDFCFMIVSDLLNVLQCKEKFPFNRQQRKTYYMLIQIMYKEPKLQKSTQNYKKACKQDGVV